jgi:hypothetical protein
MADGGMTPTEPKVDGDRPAARLDLRHIARSPASRQLMLLVGVALADVLPTPISRAAAAVAELVVPPVTAPDGYANARNGYTPYVDVTLPSTPELGALAGQTGIRHVALAFINDSGQCVPAWGAYPVDALDSAFNTHLLAQVADLRRQGGDVMVSFGGPIGPELASTCTDASALKAQYRRVIEQFGLHKIDFDIEGAEEGRLDTLQQRARVLAELQDELPGLQIWLTLPASSDGLDEARRNIVRLYLDAGVDLTGVNLMEMRGSEQAATTLVATLHALLPHKSHAQLWRMVGITPMIGRNEGNDELFTLDDARRLLAWSEKRDIGMLGIWSVARDHTCIDNSSAVSPECSSIPQADYAFSTLLQAFQPVPLHTR